MIMIIIIILFIRSSPENTFSTATQSFNATSTKLSSDYSDLRCKTSFLNTIYTTNTIDVH